VPLTFFSLAFFIASLVLSSCAPVPTKKFKKYAVVKVQTQEDLPKVAEHLLEDPDNDWVIREFNNVDKIKPNQTLVVPLTKFKRGGLSYNGYQTVPVLSYFQFSEKKENNLVITRENFESQMKYLKDNGYQVITLEKFYSFLQYKEQIPDKSVVITLEDGWESVYKIAVPILQKYGYPATLFVYSNMISKNKSALTWEQVKEMSGDGFDIQCQSISKRDLTLPKKKESFKKYVYAVIREVTTPKNLLQKKLGKECQFYAYPQGKANNLVVSLIKKAGYKAAFTMEQGSNPFFANNYSLKRNIIRGTDSISEFKKNLTYFEKY